VKYKMKIKKNNEKRGEKEKSLPPFEWFAAATK
jgi:hypothetical protein